MTRLALFIPSLDGGGAERVMVNLARGFVQQGIQVDLVLARAQGVYLAEIDPQVAVVDLAAPRVVRALFGLRRYFLESRPSAVLSALDHANLIAILAARLVGAPFRLAITVHNVVGHSSASYRDRVTMLGTRILYRLADEVVAVSKGTAAEVSRVSGLSRDRIKVIHNPVALDEVRRLASEPLDHPWFRPGEPPVIVGAGRLTEDKDFPTLLRAFRLIRRVRPARLVILGDGQERPRLESLARELGIERDVWLPGFVDNPYKYMRLATVFAHSSRSEGFGLVLVEAMAVGTPVVSTDAHGGGPREILDNGRWGRLVPVGDSEALAQSLIQSLANPMRGEATQRAEDFSLERVVERYANVLRLPVATNAKAS